MLKEVEGLCWGRWKGCPRHYLDALTCLLQMCSLCAIPAGAEVEPALPRSHTLAFVPSVLVHVLTRVAASLTSNPGADIQHVRLSGQSATAAEARLC